MVIPHEQSANILPPTLYDMSEPVRIKYVIHLYVNRPTGDTVKLPSYILPHFVARN